MSRTGALPEDWDIRSSTTKRVALHGPPTVQTYASRWPGRGPSRGRGSIPTGPARGRGIGGATRGRGAYHTSSPGPSRLARYEDHDRAQPEPSFGRGGGRGRGGIRANDTWRPPTSPRREAEDRQDWDHRDEEMNRKKKSYSPSLPTDVRFDGPAPSSSRGYTSSSSRPYPSSMPPSSSTSRLQGPVYPSLSSLPRPPSSSTLPAKPGWATQSQPQLPPPSNAVPPPSRPTARPSFAPNSAPSPFATLAPSSMPVSATTPQPEQISTSFEPSRDSSPIYVSDHKPKKMKFKPYNPNVLKKKGKAKEKEKVLGKSQGQSQVQDRDNALIQEEEDEINDVKPIIMEESEEVFVDQEPKTSGVLAFAKSDMPPICFSKNKPERELARTSFRKKRFKHLRSEGKKPGQVIWRDDGLAINWELIPAPAPANEVTVSTPNQVSPTRPLSPQKTGGESAERPKKKSKKDHPPIATPVTPPVPAASSSSSMQPRPNIKEKATAPSSKNHLPTPPRTHTPPVDVPASTLATSSKLEELERQMAKRINAIDNWTKLLKQYPSQSEKLMQQVERMQDEIFGLQEQIVAERSRLEAGGGVEGEAEEWLP